MLLKCKLLTPFEHIIYPSSSAYPYQCRRGLEQISATIGRQEKYTLERLLVVTKPTHRDSESFTFKFTPMI